MVEDQMRFYTVNNCFTLLQSITVASIENKIIVLDGCHRIRAYEELAKRGYPIDNVVLPVVIYNLKDQNELIECYNMINKNVPIPPIEKRITPETCKAILCNLIQTNYSNYIKINTMCKAPHISLEDFKVNLDARNIHIKLQERNIAINGLWDRIEYVNNYIEQNVKSSNQLCPKMKKRLVECESKAVKMNCKVCYLGIWRRFEWLDLALYLMNNSQMPNISDFTVVRVKIAAAVREIVWKKVNTNVSDYGMCYVCETQLNYCNMECGHIIAKAIGGCDTVENLMPVCKSCNRDMGIMNLNEYRDMLNQSLNKMIIMR
jgi:hypothetical protein